MDSACEERGCLKRNVNCKETVANNQKASDEIFGICNEERSLRKSNINKATDMKRSRWK